MAAAPLALTLATHETSLQAKAFEALEQVVSSAEYLHSLQQQQAAVPAVVQTARRKGFKLRWGKDKVSEVQLHPSPKQDEGQAETSATAITESSSAAVEGVTSDLQLEPPFLLVDSSDAPAEEFTVINKADAAEAMAFYIAMCIVDMPEAQGMSPKQLQTALKQTLKGLRKRKVRQAWLWGRQVYRWGALSYSALQMYQNPWLVRAVLQAIWYATKASRLIM